MNKVKPGIYIRPDGSYDIRTTVRLLPQVDSDILELLLSTPSPGLAAMVRNLMRNGIAGPGPAEEEQEVEIDLSGFGGEI